MGGNSVMSFDSDFGLDSNFDYADFSYGETATPDTATSDAVSAGSSEGFFSDLFSFDLPSYTPTPSTGPNYTGDEFGLDANFGFANFGVAPQAQAQAVATPQQQAIANQQGFSLVPLAVVAPQVQTAPLGPVAAPAPVGLPSLDEASMEFEEENLTTAPRRDDFGIDPVSLPGFATTVTPTAAGVTPTTAAGVTATSPAGVTPTGVAEATATYASQPTLTSAAPATPTGVPGSTPLGSGMPPMSVLEIQGIEPEIQALQQEVRAAEATQAGVPGVTETGVPEATPATPTRRDDFNLDQATPGFTQQAQPFAGVTPVAAPREQTGQVSAAMPRPAPRALEAQVVAQQKAQEAKLTERNRALGLDPNFDFAQFAPPPKAVAQSLANPITTPPPKNAVEFAAQMVARAGKKLGKSAIDFAARMLGKGEKPNRAQLNNFMKEAGINIDVMTTAWCAAYVNAALEYAGKTGTGKLNARSFMSWGRATTNPQPGDIAVYSRGNPKGWQGHVGLVTGTDPRGRVSVISGNTSGPGLGKGGVADKVMSTGRLLGYRTDRP